MAEKLGSCERNSNAIGNFLLRHPLSSFRELLIDHPGFAGQMERRLSRWIESDVRAFEVVQELGSFGMAHAGLTTLAMEDEDDWRIEA